MIHGTWVQINLKNGRLLIWVGNTFILGDEYCVLISRFK